MKTRQQLIQHISDLCEKHGCTEKISGLHRAQYVDRHWNPHPSDSFEAWWKTHPDYTQGIDVERAYNCQRYHGDWREARSVGAV